MQLNMKHIITFSTFNKNALENTTRHYNNHLGLISQNESMESWRPCILIIQTLLNYSKTLYGIRVR